ncbi:MAG: hypothetical protein QW057_03490 [Candidatus Bathyarchaeia archaeon]
MEAPGFGPRNAVERWLRTLKERTRRFYPNFQAGRGLVKAELFLRLYTSWYNWVRPPRSLGASPSLKAEKVTVS